MKTLKSFYENLDQDTKEFVEGGICFVVVVTVIFGGMCLLNWDYFSIVK
jgi:hypothetical protein